MAITAVLPSRTYYFTDVVTMLDGSGSTTTDPNGITQYQFDFGDGTIVTTTENVAFHRYTAPHTGITVSLTVTNSLLETNTVSYVINVVSPEIDTSQQIRRYIIQFMDVFNNMVVVNKDGTTLTVPIVYGGSDRVQAYIRGESSSGELGTSIPLPILSATMVGIDLRTDAFKPSHPDAGRYMIDPNNADEYQYSINPTPVALSMDLGIWAYDYGQAFSILETIIPWFNPEIYLNTGLEQFEGTSTLVFEGINDKNVIDLGADRRLVRYDIEFRIDGWMPRNRFVSDKINQTYYNLNLTL